MAIDTLENKQKLLSALNELSMPDANTKQAVREVTVILGPECESASCTLL